MASQGPSGPISWLPEDVYHGLELEQDGIFEQPASGLDSEGAEGQCANCMG